MLMFDGWGTRLPEGVEETSAPGTYEAICRGCGEWTEILCDISELPKDVYDEHWCGKDPRCCP